jgi:NAD(P)-dependent dehydrogenase (short-subunit alcohol dehydrogenase family)
MRSNLVYVVSLRLNLVSAFLYFLIQAAASIRASVTGSSLQVCELDLCSYRSVLAFAATVEKLVGDGPRQLRLLVNNAGAFTLTQRWTDDRIDR